MTNEFSPTPPETSGWYWFTAGEDPERNGVPRYWKPQGGTVGHYTGGAAYESVVEDYLDPRFGARIPTHAEIVALRECARIGADLSANYWSDKSDWSEFAAWRELMEEFKAALTKLDAARGEG